VFHNAVCFDDNQLAVLWGRTGQKHMRLHLLNVRSGEWIEVKVDGDKPLRRIGCSCTVIGRQLLLYGGFTEFRGRQAVCTDLRVLDLTDDGQGIPWIRNPEVLQTALGEVEAKEPLALNGSVPPVPSAPDTPTLLPPCLTDPLPRLERIFRELQDDDLGAALFNLTCGTHGAASTRYRDSGINTPEQEKQPRAPHLTVAASLSLPRLASESNEDGESSQPSAQGTDSRPRADSGSCPSSSSLDGPQSLEPPVAAPAPSAPSLVPPSASSAISQPLDQSQQQQQPRRSMGSPGGGGGLFGPLPAGVPEDWLEGWDNDDEEEHLTFEQALQEELRLQEEDRRRQEKKAAKRQKQKKRKQQKDQQ